MAAGHAIKMIAADKFILSKQGGYPTLTMMIPIGFYIIYQYDEDWASFGITIAGNVVDD